MWHQVRCMAAVLLMVGRGQEDPSVVAQLLDVEAHPRVRVKGGALRGAMFGGGCMGTRAWPAACLGGPTPRPPACACRPSSPHPVLHPRTPIPPDSLTLLPPPSP